VNDDETGRQGTAESGHFNIGRIRRQVKLAMARPTAFLLQNATERGDLRRCNLMFFFYFTLQLRCKPVLFSLYTHKAYVNEIPIRTQACRCGCDRTGTGNLSRFVTTHSLIDRFFIDIINAFVCRAAKFDVVL